MTRRGPRALPAARAVGSLLALTAAATVAAAVGRVSAGADQPALADALAAIAGHAWRYGAGVARRPANAAGAPRRGADSRLRPPVR